ncbi:glycine-rich domain-containing protein [Nocardioides sp.]|uniref:glycine-rich domain-containing protein n=1 Tax=Nocardioides sp. TaxID=35761 RepID=UPI0035180733
MAIYRTITGDLDTITGGTYRNLRITVWHNVIVEPGLVDLEAPGGPKTFLPGPQRIIPAAGDTFSVALIDTGGQGTNVTNGSLRWTMRITWTDATGTPQVAQVSNFQLIADSDFGDLVNRADPPATVANLLLTQMQALLAQAQEIATEVEAISGIDTTDSAVKALVDGPTATRDSVDARIALRATVVRTYTTTDPLTIRYTTWDKPVGLKCVEVIVIAGGGGGGSGRRGAAGTNRYGGGGGQGGGFSRAMIPAALLANSEPITIGNGGAGGAAVTTDDTSGAAGTIGGSSVFGDPARGGVAAWRGGSGAGGTTVSGNGPAASGGGGATGGSSSNTAAASDGASAVTLAAGAGGGGGGGAISAADVAYSGGLGGAQRATYPFVANTALGATPSAAAAGAAMPGLGGPGGSASLTAAGGDGIAGARYGAGGGGGAASLNGFNSGKGGDGAPGIVIVIEHY